METYILFLNGNFENRKELEDFTSHSFVSMVNVHSIKYIIEKNKTFTVIFDSDLLKEDLIKDLDKVLSDESIKLFFLFNIKDMIGIKMPNEISKMIYDVIPKESVFFIELINREDYDIDEILDKIDNLGLESLTKDEKKFLDNFKM